MKLFIRTQWSRQRLHIHCVNGGAPCAIAFWADDFVNFAWLEIQEKEANLLIFGVTPENGFSTECTLTP